MALLGPVPPLAGRASVIPLEALLLDGVGQGAICLAYDRFAAAFPQHTGTADGGSVLSHEDLRSMARFAAAALVVDDPTLIEDHLDWLMSVLGGGVAASVLASAACLVAEAVEPEAPTGARLLRAAADRIVA